MERKGGPFKKTELLEALTHQLFFLFIIPTKLFVNKFSRKKVLISRWSLKPFVKSQRRQIVT